MLWKVLSYGRIVYWNIVFSFESHISRLRASSSWIWRGSLSLFSISKCSFSEHGSAALPPAFSTASQSTWLPNKQSQLVLTLFSSLSFAPTHSPSLIYSTCLSPKTTLSSLSSLSPGFSVPLIFSCLLLIALVLDSCTTLSWFLTFSWAKRNPPS